MRPQPQPREGTAEVPPRGSRGRQLIQSRHAACFRRPIYMAMGSLLETGVPANWWADKDGSGHEAAAEAWFLAAAPKAVMRRLPANRRRRNIVNKADHARFAGRGAGRFSRRNGGSGPGAIRASGCSRGFQQDTEIRAGGREDEERGPTETRAGMFLTSGAEGTR